MSVKYKYGEIRFSNFQIQGFTEITSCMDLNENESMSLLQDDLLSQCCLTSSAASLALGWYAAIINLLVLISDLLLFSIKPESDANENRICRFI